MGSLSADTGHLPISTTGVVIPSFASCLRFDRPECVTRACRDGWVGLSADRPDSVFILMGWELGESARGGRHFGFGFGGLAVLLLPVVPASAASTVRFSWAYHDSPGTGIRSNASLNAEYVALRNFAKAAINLYRWIVRDKTSHVFA